MTGANSADAQPEEAKEHEAIADKIRSIRIELAKASPDATWIYDSLRSLLEMTKAHFKHEEDHMIIDSYPGMLLHKRDHDYLVKGLSDFTSSLIDGAVSLSPSLGEELQSWLRFHIKRFDEAYQNYLDAEKTSAPQG